MFHPFTCVSRVSPNSLALAVVFGVVFWFVFLFVFPLFGLFCKCQRCFFSLMKGLSGVQQRLPVLRCAKGHNPDKIQQTNQEDHLE